MSSSLTLLVTPNYSSTSRATSCKRSRRSLGQPSNFGAPKRRANCSACLPATAARSIDSNGRTIWIADAHRDGKRFVVHADELLTAFLELESAILADET